MSLSLYKRVMVIYLIPCHTHMNADCVVAWEKQSLNKKNIYAPAELVEDMDKVKSVSEELIDFRDKHMEIFIGWDTFMDKYLAKMPAGFKGNYIFDFFDGAVTMKYLYVSEESVTVRLARNAIITDCAMWRKFFNIESKDVSIKEVRLL